MRLPGAGPGVTCRTLVEHTRMAWLRERLASLDERIAATEDVLKITEHPRAWELTLNGLQAMRERLSAQLTGAERNGEA